MVALIELIVRAVIATGDRILVARKPGAAHTFLPGGHVEPGEPAAAAVLRELREELGMTGRVERFLGAVEHGWRTADGAAHELNLLFLVTAPGLGLATPPVPREPHLQFFWHPLDRLNDARLEPWILRTVLPGWLASDGPGWASTLAVQ
ncbi:MAG: NUDIX domain-containing protein [Armatimonadota bacterium]|nr:NUDIX domain-containing protein [Armatimonadota bacterium]MDR7532029.1 NUDIX domain-containing protein [Armatimonadota bacterium]MDR7535960.1 NUDIX domain-containing protein [Armatimonadota bacterium]